MRTLLSLLGVCGMMDAQVALERLRNGAWQEIPAATVVDSGEQVRFRYRATSEGYVYLVNQGSSGRRVLLFPSPETGRDNRVEAGGELLVPGSEAFRVSGPAGHDTLYWITSPVPLGDADRRALARPAKRPPLLLPRCDDGILRARGDCSEAPGARPAAVTVREFILYHQ